MTYTMVSQDGTIFRTAPDGRKQQELARLGYTVVPAAKPARAAGKPKKADKDGDSR